VSKAYDKCFGTDYDFDDLAENGDGKDRDGDGLPDEFNKAETCFYRAMGWDDKTGADTIKADMAGLEAGMRDEFGGNVDKCAAWSGDFSSSRVRREAGQGAEQVPQLFEGGARNLGWLKSLVRRTRSAEPQKNRDRADQRKANRQATKKNNNNNKGKGGKGKGKGVRKGKGNSKSQKK